MTEPTDPTPDTSFIAPVRRVSARSGRVDFSAPIVLHESARSKVTAVPFFIPRSTGDVDTTVKLQGYTKDKVQFFNSWIEREEKSLTLDAAATQRLYAALCTFYEAAGNAPGQSFLTVPIGEGIADLTGHQPAQVARALVRALESGEVVEHLANTDISIELALALRQSVKLREMQSAVAELRANLDSGSAEESVYQDWCERHSWAFGNMYVLRDDIRDIGPHDSLDMLIPGVVTGYRDIIELKRPDKPVVLEDVARRSWYFSADVSKAIGQCHRYLDLLGDVARQGLRDHPEIIAYHPRATIVIGRSNDWNRDQHQGLHGLNARLASIQVMTFDHLLARAERMLELIRIPDPEPQHEP
jgi:hypothetical protein